MAFTAFFAEVTVKLSSFSGSYQKKYRKMAYRVVLLFQENRLKQ